MSRRTERLGVLFREEISGMLQKGLKHADIGMVTIQRVDITEDLSYAKVRVSTLGSPEERKKAVFELQKRAGFIRQTLGKAIKIRKVPELTFVEDANLEHAARIEEILSELKAEGDLD